MILTPYARVIYTSTGTVQNYNVPFPYLDFDHIHIYAIDPDTRKRSTEYAIDQWVTGSRIRPAAVPPSGQKFMIERITPRDAALIDFADGAVIEAEDLDTSVLQNLYICEELIDELEWTGNEVSLLWQAHAQLVQYYQILRADHDNLDARESNHYIILTQAIASLRASLEETDALAHRADTKADDVKSWLCQWYKYFLPAIRNFINIVAFDGGNAATFTEINCIIDGEDSAVDFEAAIIYDGHFANDYEGYAWTPEAMKLMYAYDYSNLAYHNALKAKREIEAVYSQVEELIAIKDQLMTIYDAFNSLFSGGSTGQVIVRTNSGLAWTDLEDVPVDPTNS